MRILRLMAIAIIMTLAAALGRGERFLVIDGGDSTGEE